MAGEWPAEGLEGAVSVSSSDRVVMQVIAAPPPEGLNIVSVSSSDRVVMQVIRLASPDGLVFSFSILIGSGGDASRG